MSLGLAKTYTKPLAQRVQQDGKFQVLERLLDVGEMDVRRLGNGVRPRDGLLADGMTFSPLMPVARLIVDGRTIRETRGEDVIQSAET